MIVYAVAALAIVGGFWVGAIPFGVLVGHLFFRRDIRTEGSGNIGAANALRILGKKGAALVLILDALKGMLPVVAVTLSGGTPAIAALAGGAAVLGHCFSPFLKGRGGKGVATSYGAIWALAWAGSGGFYPRLDRYGYRDRLRVGRIDARERRDAVRPVVHARPRWARLRYRFGAIYYLQAS